MRTPRSCAGTPPSSAAPRPRCSPAASASGGSSEPVGSTCAASVASGASRPSRSPSAVPCPCTARPRQASAPTRKQAPANTQPCSKACSASARRGHAEDRDQHRDAERRAELPRDGVQRGGHREARAGHRADGGAAERGEAESRADAEDHHPRQPLAEEVGAARRAWWRRRPCPPPTRARPARPRRDARSAARAGSPRAPRRSR